MAINEQYKEYVLEMLEPLGPIATGQFFGGVGIAYRAVQFAMIMESSLYFVVDDTTRPKYEAAGMKSFSYATKKGRIQVRKYFELPEDVLTDPETMKQWALEAIHVAGSANRPKQTNKPKRATKKKTKTKRRLR